MSGFLWPHDITVVVRDTDRHPNAISYADWFGLAKQHTDESNPGSTWGACQQPKLTLEDTTYPIEMNDWGQTRRQHSYMIFAPPPRSKTTGKPDVRFIGDRRFYVQHEKDGKRRNVMQNPAGIYQNTVVILPWPHPMDADEYHRLRHAVSGIWVEILTDDYSMDTLAENRFDPRPPGYGAHLV